MDTNQNMEERLWQYIDGRLSAPEKNVIEQLLENDAAWKSAYRELLAVSELLRSSGMDAPSMRFTRNVMEEITRLHIAPATSSYINKKIVWGIGLFFILMLAGILIYGFALLSGEAGEASGISKNLSKVDLSRIFSNTWVNIFMMVNVILGLVFLDQYFSNKRRQYQKDA